MREATLADNAMLVGWLSEREDKEGDFTPFLMDPMNVALIEDDGVAFFVWHGPGVYEVHVSFAERGREATATTHRMLAHMRERGATMFWGVIPWDTGKVSRSRRLFARLMGWKSLGRANFAIGLCELFTGE